MCKCISLILVCSVHWLSASCLLETLECLGSKNTDKKMITLIQAHLLPLISDICRQAAAGFHSLLKSFKRGREVCDKSVMMGTVLTSIFSKRKERKQTAVLCEAACGRGVERMTFERVFVWEPVTGAMSPCRQHRGRKQMLNSRTVWSHLKHPRSQESTASRRSQSNKYTSYLSNGFIDSYECTTWNRQ